MDNLKEFENKASTTQLSREIDSLEQLESMSVHSLEEMLALHEQECVVLKGIRDISNDENWLKRSKQALRVLNLHKDWVKRELTKRKQAEHERFVKESADARLKRIEMANDEDRLSHRIFAEVARDTLGVETYEYLWELARQRLNERD